MTFVGVDVGAGRARVKFTGGNLASRLISVDPMGARVALVATTALLLGGDRVDIEIVVGPGAWLEIVETAGTVAYDAAGVPSSWNVTARVAAGGMLLWHGEPFVVADGADTLRRSHFDLDEDSLVCLRETVVLGRSGETGGSVRIRNHLRRGGESILLEDLDLRAGQTRRLPGILGSTNIVDTVTLVGIGAPSEPPIPIGQRFELDPGPRTTGVSGATGTIGRALRRDLAGSPAGRWWSAWSTTARQAYAVSR